MTDKKETPISLIATLDQIQSTLKDTAPIFSEYYRSLKQTGMPSELAYVLTKEFHEIYWKSVFPDAAE